jgi:cell division protein FtsB
MWTRQHRQRNTGRLIVPTLCAAVLAYFGFHAYHGEYGINSKYKLQASPQCGAPRRGYRDDTLGDELT